MKKLCFLYEHIEITWWWFKICVERCLERGKNSGRTDDNVDSLTLRIKTYNESTLPIIQHFDAMNMVKRVDAAKTEVEVFFKLIFYKKIDNFF